MARTIASVVDSLLARTRLVGNIGLTQDFATEILTISQQIANAHLKKVITTANLTVNSNDIFYTLLSEFSDAIDILSMRVSGRKLLHFKTLEELSAYDPEWYTSAGESRVEGWHQIGRDYLIVYPGVTTGATVSCEYTKATTIKTSYAGLGAATMDLNDEDTEVALKIAELLLLVRSKKPKVIKAALDDLTLRLGINNVEK